MMVPCYIHNLQPGDMVDLEGDQFADPNNSNQFLEYEYTTVESMVEETSECTVIYFEGMTVGFPPNHIVQRVLMCCCEHDENVIATHLAPQSYDAREWIFVPVCGDHLNTWWDGGDFTAEQAPAAREI
jgi:hypothetical protein